MWIKDFPAIRSSGLWGVWAAGLLVAANVTSWQHSATLSIWRLPTSSHPHPTPLQWLHPAMVLCKNTAMLSDGVAVVFCECQCIMPLFFLMKGFLLLYKPYLFSLTWKFWSLHQICWVAPQELPVSPGPSLYDWTKILRSSTIPRSRKSVWWLPTSPKHSTFWAIRVNQKVIYRWIFLDYIQTAPTVFHSLSLAHTIWQWSFDSLRFLEIDFTCIKQ